MASDLRGRNPAAQGPPTTSSPQPSTASAQRFSWLETSAEMEQRSFQSRGQYQPAMPPLPSIPQHLEDSRESRREKEPIGLDHSHQQMADLSSPGIPCPPLSPYAVMARANADPQENPRSPQNYPQSPHDYPQSPEQVGLNAPGNRNSTLIEPDQNPLAAMSPVIIKSTRPHEVGSNGHLPGQVTHPNQQMKGGSWKHGLFDCSDAGVCCTGVFCPCVLYGRTSYRLSQRSRKNDPTNMLGHQTVNGSCIAFAVLCGCNMILAAVQHTRIRRMYRIPGSIGSDCVEGVCCCCCTLSQDEKEMKYREDHARRYAGPATGAQYEPPSAMEYASPV